MGDPSGQLRGGYCPNSKTGLRNIRRIVQLVSLALWVFLFLVTRHQAAAFIPPDLFLMTDPLAAAIAMGAAHIVVPIMAASLVLVLLGMIFGRVFCGWLCPLGTLIDGMAKIFRPPENRFSQRTHQRMQRWKYYILTFIVFGALLSTQWIYLLDPLVVLFRGVASGIYPVVAAAFPKQLDMSFHQIAFLPLLLLLAILLLTAVTPRFYCRYLCPLGALYGLLARIPLLRRRVSGCDACSKVSTRKQCISGCRMGAVPANPHRTLNHECVRCFSGRSFCHKEAIRFDFMLPFSISGEDRRKKKPSPPPEDERRKGDDRRKTKAGPPPVGERRKPDTPLELSRRSFLVVGAVGLGLAPLVAGSSYHRGDPLQIVRPPRVLDEQTFIDQCIRCGMCVQACPSQTLQLVHLQSGLAGLWTPAITPRVGGCLADCNACSVACPTDAIPEFSKHEADRWATKMGTAVLETSRCISYTEDQPCKKCIEICPTKAFLIEPASGHRPLRPAGVSWVRCMGCGLCEHACRKIVFGRPAVTNFSHGRGQSTSLRYEPSDSYEPPQGIG
jgi:polyferredoxin